MKKLVSALLFGIMALSAIPMLAAAGSLPDEMTAEQFAVCDFDENGFIDTLDVYFILKYFANKEANVSADMEFEYGYTEQVKANVAADGDINGDGNVNAIDAAILLTYMKENTQCKVDEGFGPAQARIMTGDEIKPGDVDGNGIIDAVDASNILAYYACMSTDSPIYTVQVLTARYKGDINGDGIVDAIDASAALKIYAENATS